MSWNDRLFGNSTPAGPRRTPGVPARGPDGKPAFKSIPPRQAWWTFVAILLANHLLVRFLFPSPGDPLTIP